ncbi:MAG: hypothetical protein HY237_00750 [Acidobacteria bacterium]|nr:hypothetical protein [Acidobacteriota bacterium]
MAKFEQVGRRIDKELAKLQRYLKKEVEPAARRKAAKALRKASERLAAAAKELNVRVARMTK